MKRSMIYFLAIGLCLAFAACGPTPAPTPTVVASTAWTAAYVKAAGIDDCRVIAPYEIQHPAEYELRPEDIKTIAGAKVFVYGGYETMMKSLATNISDGRIALVKIATDYDPDNMENSIRAIAAAAGTIAQAEKNIATLKAAFASCREEVRTAGGVDRPTLAHVFQKRLAELFGLKIVSAFGPAPLEAKQIALLSRTRATLVIDNWHNPVSAPLKETLAGARFVEFINFPGKDGTRMLEDVLRYNKDRLFEALQAK
jgi:zinc transport system substrate-binding protein